MFIQNYYPGNFAFLILIIPELFNRKVCEMFVYKHALKNELIFKKNIKFTVE